MTKVRAAKWAASLPLCGPRRLSKGAYIPPSESWQETVRKVRASYSEGGAK